MALILLLTDFSPISLNACVFALRSFGTENNEYLLLHIYWASIPDDTAPAAVGDEMYKASVEAMDLFRNRIAALPNTADMVVRTDVRYGPLRAVVEQTCKELEVDVVVMGTHPSTDTSFLGSNASELVKHSKVPLLIVPEEARPTGLGRILFADDHKGVEPFAMRWLIRLAQRHYSVVTIAHVVRNENELPDRRIVEDYNTALANVEHTFIGIPGDDVALSLSNLADSLHMDLAVVLHRHLGVLDSLFHSSTAKRFALHTRVPLLVLEH
ncbi:MAG: universal stress protein [Flavobacteriales bacterium]|nr:universal stress protein [Flavobacteriales bacterium]